jgi:hypothetical protein
VENPRENYSVIGGKYALPDAFIHQCFIIGSAKNIPGHDGLGWMDGKEIESYIYKTEIRMMLTHLSYRHDH